MFPPEGTRKRRQGGLPRLGGGVSASVLTIPAHPRSSPPRRGCFLAADVDRQEQTVFPASAGVFRADLRSERRDSSLPRLGGGVSLAARWIASAKQSSPPRRGCFSNKHLKANTHKVFPASAGVFPSQPSLKKTTESLPRLGGGVSRQKPLRSIQYASSPPRRGCFPPRMGVARRLMVFPASAGVFLASGKGF